MASIWNSLARTEHRYVATPYLYAELKYQRSRTQRRAHFLRFFKRGHRSGFTPSIRIFFRNADPHPCISFLSSVDNPALATSRSWHRARIPLALLGLQGDGCMSSTFLHIGPMVIQRARHALDAVAAACGMQCGRMPVMPQSWLADGWNPVSGTGCEMHFISGNPPQQLRYRTILRQRGWYPMDSA